MPTIDVEPVTTERGRRAFVQFPWRIYRDDPNWLPPLILERLVADCARTETGKPQKFKLHQKASEEVERRRQDDDDFGQ